MKIFRSFRCDLRRVLPVLAALALVLWMAGCELNGVYLITVTSVFPDEVEQGRITTVRLELSNLRAVVDSVFVLGNRDVSAGVPAIFPGSSAVQVGVSATVGGSLESFQLLVSYHMAGDSSSNSRDALSPPIYVHRQGAGPAPRINSLSPENFPRGARETLTIRGLNFDDSAKVFLEDVNSVYTRIPGETERFDPATGAVQVTLELPGDAPLGERKLRLETDAGISAPAIFIVTQAPAPVISGLFPNVVVAGEQQTIAIVGSDFYAGAMGRLDTVGPDPQPAEIVRPGTQRRAVDRLELTVRGNSAGAVPVRVESAGGLSDPVPLEVSPPSFPGPRLARVTPSQVFAGTTSQVVVVVENVDAAQVSAVQVLRREAGAEAELLATTLSPTATRLVRLDVPAGVAGFFDLALSTESGRNTNVLPVEVVAPPPGKPFVRSTRVGRIALGSTGLGERINGERLANAREVVFTPPVVTATLLPGNTDSVVPVSLNAVASGDISGDVRTTFRVRTDAGWSNEADYLVTDTGATFPPSLMPSLDRVFPNFVYPGPLKSHFSAIGNLLAPPAALAVDPAAAVRDPRVADLTPGMPVGRLLALEMFVPAPAGADTLSVAVTNTNGDSTNSRTIRVLGANDRRGPEITGMETTAPGFFSGTISQFRIVGRNFGPPESMALIFAERSGSRATLRQGLQIFAPTTPRADGLDSVVVQFAVQVEAQAMTEFFAVTVDGLDSSLAGEFTRALPPATGPFITGLSRAEISRPPIVSDGGILSPGTLVVAIEGFGLENIDRLEFDSRGLSAVPFVLGTAPDPPGSSYGVVITAAPDAELTGDALTTFRVITTGGQSSNTVGLIVKP